MVEIDPERDYYDILGLPVDAGADEIRSAYRALARQCHPDTGRGDVERFRLVQEAYEVLCDRAYRSAYDRQREQRGIHDAGPVSLTLQQNREQLPVMEDEQMLYVLADICPRESYLDARRALNLALVVDRSTSMQGPRIHHVKMAANDLIESLQPTDRLALVTFSDRAEVIIPSSPVEETRSFRSAIASITAEGGTEIYQGLSAGIGQVRPYVAPQTINHVILLTDGRTYGDEEVALITARRAEAEGIGISALGIGEDWHDAFLDNLARSGGGTSDYIDAPAKIRRVLQAQIRGLASLALKRVRFRANMAPYVRMEAAYRVAPYMEILEVDSGNVVETGNLLSGEASSLALEFTVKHTSPGKRRLARFSIEGDDIGSDNRLEVWRDLNVTFTENPSHETVPPRMFTVLARLSIFRLQERAWTALESGDRNGASRYLESAATQLFDLGYRELGQAAMLEVDRLAHGAGPTGGGRKKLRYGTRALSLPSV